MGRVSRPTNHAGRMNRWLIDDAVLGDSEGKMLSFPSRTATLWFVKHRSMKPKRERKQQPCPRDFLLVQADNGASGVWARGGCVGDLSWLGVSSELEVRFKKWIRHYETLLDDKPFDWDAFSSCGRELAIGLKRELPEVSISYFDESRNRNRPETLPAIWEDIE